MPVYEYEHNEEVKCSKGRAFEVYQAFSDTALKVCPECGELVHRLIGRVFVSTPITDTQLKNMGFAKLVRRDKGVYENVTALDGESKVMEAGKSDTLPDIKRRITD